MPSLATNPTMKSSVAVEGSGRRPCLPPVGFAVVMGLLAATLAFSADATAPRYAEFIAGAGNAESDPARLAHLRKLAHRCSVDGTTLAGLEALIKFVERWDSPESRLDFFDREIRRTLSFDFGIDEQSPLHPIAAFYRARML